MSVPERTCSFKASAWSSFNGNQNAVPVERQTETGPLVVRTRETIGSWMRLAFSNSVFFFYG